MHEIKSINLKTPKADKPFFDNRDMCGFMCVICAALITYLLFDKGILICNGLTSYMLVVWSVMLVIAHSLFGITQRLVRFCYFRAKRKAHDNKVKDLNKNSIK